MKDRQTKSAKLSGRSGSRIKKNTTSRNLRNRVRADDNKQPAVSCVDLFCGAGGLTYGMAKEGLSVNAGIDIDPACRYPYSANNNARLIQRDISDMEASEILQLFTPGTIRVLAGCAPCQPFSTYSQRYDTKSDHKWGLLYEFARITKDVLPDIVTMENVPAIRKHEVFDDFVANLSHLGYHVWNDVVECAAYGVPQSRKRMVLLASLHGPIKLIEPFRDESKFNTVIQAIGRLQPLQAGESDKRDTLHVAATLSSKNMKRIQASKPGGTWRDWPRHLVADCHKVDSGKTYPSVYGRMEWDKPAPTITTQCYGFGNGRFGHPEQERAISLREAAILQGFPKHYKFVPPNEKVCFKTVGRLIGNAVPVDLGRAIAKSIVRHIDENAVKPSKSYGRMPVVGSDAKQTNRIGKQAVVKKKKSKKKRKPLTRSEIMSRVKNKDSEAERALRSALHARGLRFRLHRRIEGVTVDIALLGPKVAVFVDGCFWHGCPKHATFPKSNQKYWLPKLAANKERDSRQTKRMQNAGWKVIRVWEHDCLPPASRIIARISEACLRGGKCR